MLQIGEYTAFNPQKQNSAHKMSYYLNKVDVEVDRLLAGANIVGNDIRYEGLFWPPWVRLLLEKTNIM